MAKYTQTCLLCKQTYEYCGGCSKYKNLPTYMTTFCSENCKNIYQTMADFENGKISKDKAELKLAGLDTTRHMFYTNSFASSYKKIVENDEGAFKKNEVIDNQLIEDVNASTTIEQIIEKNTVSSENIKEIADSISNSVNSNNHRKNRKYRKK